jgi:zinc protease
MKNKTSKTQTLKCKKMNFNHKISTRFSQDSSVIFRVNPVKSRGFILGFLICIFYFWSLIFNFATALPISRDSLNFGLKALSYQAARLPLIEMRWVTHAGSIYDPPGKEGLANITTKLLTHGTKIRSAVKISADLEFVGGSLSDATGYDVSTLHIRVLSKDTDLALDILSDILLNPVFSDSELTKVKNEIIGDIKQSYDYPYDVGWDKFNELLYKVHPYAHPINGDTISVAKITRKDIIDFYNKYYTVDNGFLIIAGDFDKTELLKKIGNKFALVGATSQSRQSGLGNPSHRETIIPNFEPGPYSQKAQAYYINQPDLNQSYVFIGFPGIAETSPDYFPTRVMNFVLGGSPLTSRLGSGVRETQGLAYDVRSFFDRRLYGGSFVSTTQTSDPNKAIGIMLNEITKMYQSGATQDELNRAKTFYIGNFPFNYDATRDKIDLLQNIEVYHKGLDYPDKFNSYIEKLTLNDINQAAKKYLYPNNYLLVIVTNVPKDSLQVQGIEWLN